jgi:hypothetical protein
MPSLQYQKTKQYSLAWKSRNIDRVRELARKYKRNKDAYKKVLKEFYMIGLN